ncbi:MAG TPA: alpha-1,2-fucosyltransferase [Phnomibacter sp.]|nr:alpha-1,2-fucosyltransferase [Phnomibacter sp.]
MIVVKLQGGLGNQMFQYAIGKAMATRLHCSFYFDHRFLDDRSANANWTFRTFDLDVFGLPERRADTQTLASFFSNSSWLKNKGVQLGWLKPNQVIKERHFHYDGHLQYARGHLYLDGYWQSPKYFENVQDELRKELRIVIPTEPGSGDLLNRIRNCNSVCINVRRGDFLSNSFHAVCSENYFENAISYMQKNISDPIFFVFSDDKDWAQQVFGEMGNAVIVGEIHDGLKYSNKLMLMAACKHFIIPNSSFAWWAVWLANQKDNIVIAPQTWFNDPAWDTRDLVPEHWIRLTNA